MGNNRPTVYSIGYSRRTVTEISDIATALGALVVDVRGNPVSRKPGFGRRQLEASLGELYRWLGGSGLGNRPPKQTVTAEGVRALTTGDRPLILMCQCGAPFQCHRHTLIARPLLKDYGVDVMHIHQDPEGGNIIIRASDLDNEAIPEDELPYIDLQQHISGLGQRPNLIQSSGAIPKMPDYDPKKLEQLVKNIDSLAARWADEQEFEPWADYVEYAKKATEAAGFTFDRLIQRPFTLEFKMGDQPTRMIVKHNRIITETGPAKSSAPHDQDVAMGQVVKIPELFID